MTRQVPFYLVDVFADEPLEGNPLAVVSGAEALEDDVLARIAREMKQSETTFVLPVTRPGAHWRLRSFTAAGIEVFGAGHNSLGAWWWLAESGALALGETGGKFVQEIGPRQLPVEVICEGSRLLSVVLTQAEPQFGKTLVGDSGLASHLGLRESDLMLGQLPAQVVSTGAAHLLAPVRDRAAIARARPDLGKLAELLGSIGAQGCYLFSLDPIRVDAIAHARFFNPTEGIPEDAATGSAAGPLACYLLKYRKVPDGSTVRIEQGHSMGRPSLIEVNVSNGAVRVSGRCVTVAEGTLRW